MCGSSTTPGFAEPFLDQFRENARRLAAAAGIEIEFIRNGNFSKEMRVRQVPARRGEHPGLVVILSAMELCSTSGDGVPIGARGDSTGAQVWR